MKKMFTCSLQQHSTVTIVNKMTAAMIPPVMTTVPAVIRNLLHQQPAYLWRRCKNFHKIVLDFFGVCMCEHLLPWMRIWGPISYRHFKSNYYLKNTILSASFNKIMKCSYEDLAIQL